jgi:hypothetical protein
MSSLREKWQRSSLLHKLDVLRNTVICEEESYLCLEEPSVEFPYIKTIG